MTGRGLSPNSGPITSGHLDKDQLGGCGRFIAGMLCDAVAHFRGKFNTGHATTNDDICIAPRHIRCFRDCLKLLIEGHRTIIAVDVERMVGNTPAPARAAIRFPSPGSTGHRTVTRHPSA